MLPTCGLNDNQPHDESPMSTDVLFQPFELKSLKLSNRLVMAPMTRNFAKNGIPGAAQETYYEKRAKGEPTVPTVLSRELATNPFLRADDADLRDRWGGTSPAETFAALRTAKDHF